ncbi:non-homologous end-joining DNA ligase LigD [Halovulum sp. GXIMD14794]
MGAVEFHVWPAHVDKLDRPDRLVFDLDPNETLAFADVREAARDLGAFLDEIGIETRPMVTGGKGVHLVTPLRRTVEWDALKGFAKAVAHAMAAREPERFVASMSKERRMGRIFIDYLRNERGATAVAPCSVRARPGAPVAVPVAWGDLATLDSANSFDMRVAAGEELATSPHVDLNLRSLRKRAFSALDELLGPFGEE